jgi:hypothetical protein
MKLCKDCKHHLGGESVEDDACRAGEMITTDDVVRGQGRRCYFIRCHVARSDFFLCGREARLFVAKAPAFDTRDYCTRCGARKGHCVSEACCAGLDLRPWHTWVTPHGPVVKREFWVDVPV